MISELIVVIQLICTDLEGGQESNLVKEPLLPLHQKKNTYKNCDQRVMKLKNCVVCLNAHPNQY